MCCVSLFRRQHFLPSRSLSTLHQQADPNQRHPLPGVGVEAGLGGSTIITSHSSLLRPPSRRPRTPSPLSWIQSISPLLISYHSSNRLPVRSVTVAWALGNRHALWFLEAHTVSPFALSLSLSSLQLAQILRLHTIQAYDPNRSENIANRQHGQSQC